MMVMKGCYTVNMTHHYALLGIYSIHSATHRLYSL